MKQSNHIITLKTPSMSHCFLPTGDVYTMTSGDFLINRFRGNMKDGSTNNIYLRIYQNGIIQYHPLLGAASGSRISFHKDALRYQGQFQSISYEVIFRPVENVWFWDVTLEGDTSQADLVYTQDLGVGSANGVFTNELYLSQYLGHQIIEGENGYAVCSRQNMPEIDCFPYVQQGAIGVKIIHYSTDGLQFFGLSYKEDNVPAALSGDLADCNLQYECAFTALQTECFPIKGKKTISFYGLFMENHPQIITSLEFGDTIKSLWALRSEDFSNFQPAPEFTLKDIFQDPLVSPSYSTEEIDALYPQRHLEETMDHSLLSFFTKDHGHVVTKTKELLSQRPHGTIIMTPPDSDKIESSLIATTQYMYGVFNSHVVLGNTDLHKFISTPRGFLNILKNGGQRIYIKISEFYQLLALPSLFEMGMNYSRWYYRLPGDNLIVTVYTTTESPRILMNVQSTEGKKYDFIVTSQISMGPNENTVPVHKKIIENGYRFILDSSVYPGLHYDYTVSNYNAVWSDDRIFFEENTPFDETFVTCSITASSEFSVEIMGHLSSEERTLTSDRQKTSLDNSFEIQKQKALTIYEGLMNHFELSLGSIPSKQIAILNETAWWYTHNAMIHFRMPHGLEQPGGAAWGTRDICQGPMEYFLATQNFPIMREIILNIFSHQSIITKEWPQWYMFDHYDINAGECHGDVIFWPLKSVADYIISSGDVSILDENLPYAETASASTTLLEHITSAVSMIKSTRMIGDTGLITYAGGDWDDTLQPAKESMKEKLVSAWTVALAYQTFHTLSEALAKKDKDLSAELSLLAQKIHTSFNQVLINEDVITGFLQCGPTYEYLLHPKDSTTGIHYRLLPMTRSIIAELVSPAQAHKNVETIQKNLKCPDGVRLMDRPASYNGGESRLFKRAEQAANVGREISLQYTHAHIRYIEAMAKIGEKDEAWDSLFNINPILIQNSVPNANIRQSNLYFSSSDGAYNDRYDYAKNFHLLKQGEITVKGGWRLYSSGPGIYMRQLISHILGLRFFENNLIIDPVLPDTMDGLTFTFDCFGSTKTFCYHVSKDKKISIECQGKALSYETIKNAYRPGGIRVTKEALLSCEGNIDIFI